MATRPRCPLAALLWLLLGLLLAACAPTVTPTQLSPTATPWPAPTASPTAPLPSPTPSPTPVPTPTTSSSPAATAEVNIPTYTYRVAATYPHDPDAFTQGLVYYDGVLYESTGRFGQSTLRRVALETGEVLQTRLLPEDVFGEGIALLNGRIYQLTWQSRVGYIYDLSSLELIGEFYYPTEGWGLTTDGQRLIMSDGSAILHFRDPETLEELGQVEVHDAVGPVGRLNELEYVEGQVWANVWGTDVIARIDPASGQVLGWIDLSGLLDAATLERPVDVLNGIAYDAASYRLFVTGKLWPTLFEIEAVPTGR
ncbi:MAG: glutaminyl-peptide cyclotransferase [Anaerolineales bacterium]|nr:glutaminyl-peptide cyclotransferase [Anaerolineales bacterium]